VVDVGIQKEGKRNFFYQYFGGYWDERNKKFQLGQHPDGFLWNEIGERIHHGVGIMADDICHNLTLSTSEWLERFKGEAMDYLLERDFEDPQMVKGLRVPQDNPRGRRAYSTDTVAIQKRLVLGNGEDNPPDMPAGRNDNEAGPSGTTNDTV
jgi:hypothetical protein